MFTVCYALCLQMGEPSRCVTSHPRQLSLAIPSWVDVMSTSESWDMTGTLYDSRVPTGQGKLEKVREFEWSGKGQRKINFFVKVRGKSWKNE